MLPSVTVIVLNWNMPEATRRCLQAFKRQDYPKMRMLLVDNGSEKPLEMDGVETLNLPENRGYTGGNNAGLQKALSTDTDAVVIVNNDTVPHRKMIARLAEAAESDPGIGIVGARNFYLKEPRKEWFWGGYFDLCKGEVKSVYPDDNTALCREFDYVAGSCLYVKKEVFESVGLLDDRFFLYFEETEFCLRARKAGWKVVAARDAKLWHDVSLTVKELNNFNLYMYSRNRPLIVRTHATGIQFARFMIHYLLKYVMLDTMKYLHRKRLGAGRQIWAGFMDFLFQNYGAPRS